MGCRLVPLPSWHAPGPSGARHCRRRERSAGIIYSCNRIPIAACGFHLRAIVIDTLSVRAALRA